MKRSMVIALSIFMLSIGISFAETGVTDTEITLGSVLVLQGKAKGLGIGMKAGMEAAFKGQKVQGKSIKLITENDFYEPPKAVAGTKKIAGDVFLMVGNVGTPTATVTLPILKEMNIPAVGFFTGAGILRPGAGGPIINYRASYVQETAAVIDAAVANGLDPNRICAYVQNDGYGMAGITGIRKAMKRAGAHADTIAAYDKMKPMKGNNPKRNGLGPVGVYRRNTNKVIPGYKSLKAWEKKTGNSCKIVVTVGAYSNISQFARHANSKGEDWIITAVSFTGADNFLTDLTKYKSADRVIMTQVVPLLDSDSPIVAEAKAALGKKFGFVTLEGYIVGKMTLALLNNIEGEITVSLNWIQAAIASGFKLDSYSASNIGLPVRI